MSCAPNASIVRDIRVYRGSNKSPFKLRFKNPDGTLQDLAGTDFVLMASLVDGPIIASLSDGGLKYDGEFVTWAISAADSRRMPAGRLTRYSIERVEPSGTQYPVIIGHITGVDYPNVD